MHQLIRLALHFNDPDLDLEEREKEVYKLQSQLKSLDEVEFVSRVLDSNPPENNKTLGGFLVDLLMIEVSLDNFKKLMGFLGDRLSGKTIELEIEANGKKLKVKVNSREELTAAIQAAQSFVATQGRHLW